MQKSKLSILFDSILVFIITFFISHTWFVKLIKNAFFINFVCIFASFGVFFVYFMQNLKRLKNYLISKNDKSFMNECLNFFKYSSQESINIYLENLLKVKQKDLNIYVSESNIYYINFGKILTDEDFFSGLNFQANNQNLTLYFIFNDANDNFKNLLNNSPQKFKYYTFQDAYIHMKNINYFPIKKVMKQKQFIQNTKSKFNSQFNSLTKKHFKDFFISGVSLILISFFIPFSLYYKIFGSFMLLLSLVCLLKKNKINPTNNETLSNLIKK